ncbi:hypothetical protein QCA50_018083 [Cerrena zonata]|uniref:Uncharacterized protein n=1 Tax=Cerrena zonata TaxID=2478898 RepID=A0AAW0FDU5_9APHY
MTNAPVLAIPCCSNRPPRCSLFSQDSGMTNTLQICMLTTYPRAGAKLSTVSALPRLVAAVWDTGLVVERNVLVPLATGGASSEDLYRRGGITLDSRWRKEVKSARN